jgi:hypothetical protein
MEREGGERERERERERTSQVNKSTEPGLAKV